jgi:hypothetical protein
MCGPRSYKHKQQFTSKQTNAVVLIFTGREVRAATQDQGDPTTSNPNKETRFCTNFLPLVFVSPRFMQKRVFIRGGWPLTPPGNRKEAFFVRAARLDSTALAHLILYRSRSRYALCGGYRNETAA